MEEEDIAAHPMHPERYEIPAAVATAVREARARGGSVWAVGTTVVRALESAAQADGTVVEGAGETRLLIAPGYQFRVVDHLLTNFHLPRSTLLMLVAAFAGYDVMMAAYRHAVDAALPVLFLRRRHVHPLMFEFTLHGTQGEARAGTLHTPHGDVATPAFMPVGTYGTVRGLHPAEVERTGAQMMLGNTYHLHLRPGEDVVQSLGGLHAFSHWNRPMLTDSGGFQVFSLEGLRTIAEEGVAFQSHVDGSHRTITPEKSVEIQWALGADIAMQFDHVVPGGADHTLAKEGMERSLRWLDRCKARHAELRLPAPDGRPRLRGPPDPPPPEVRAPLAHRPGRHPRRPAPRAPWRASSSEGRGPGSPSAAFRWASRSR